MWNKIKFNIHEAELFQPITPCKLNTWLSRHAQWGIRHTCMFVVSGIISICHTPFALFILFQTWWSPQIWNKRNENHLLHFAWDLQTAEAMRKSFYWPWASQTSLNHRVQLTSSDPCMSEPSKTTKTCVFMTSMTTTFHNGGGAEKAKQHSSRTVAVYSPS